MLFHASTETLDPFLNWILFVNLTTPIFGISRVVKLNYKHLVAIVSWSGYVEHVDKIGMCANYMELKFSNVWLLAEWQKNTELLN